MRETILYKKLPKRAVKCLACAWYCKIAGGFTGVCGVRQNIGGKLFLLVYGRPSAVNLDPIEKKPLYHFLPTTPSLSIGTLGCNFACEFCQNFDLSQSPKEVKVEAIKTKQLDKIRKYIEKNSQEFPPEKIVETCVTQNIPSISYTYNEPAIFFEYAYDTARLAHQKGIKNVYVSNGFESKEAIAKIAPYLDAINVDLKSFRPDFYQKICYGKLPPVLENIKRFYRYGIWLEITTLVIPGLNDSEKELKEIAAFIAGLSPDIPWHISRFFPAYKMANLSPTPVATLEKAYQIGKKAGLKFVYLGNVPAGARENTYCSKCNQLLIKRVGYQTEIVGLKTRLAEGKPRQEGQCKKCQTKIPGVWR